MNNYDLYDLLSERVELADKAYTLQAKIDKAIEYIEERYSYSKNSNKDYVYLKYTELLDILKGSDKYE